MAILQRSTALSRYLGSFSRISLNPPSAYKLADLKKSVLKDGSKILIMHQVQQAEIDAWTDFYHRDQTAQVFFELYQQAADLHWSARDEVDKLEAQKNKLSAEYKDAPNKLVLDLKKPFREGQGLSVALSLRDPSADSEEEVWIGSRRAAASGSHRFTLTATDLIETKKGEVTIKINQR